MKRSHTQSIAMAVASLIIAVTAGCDSATKDAAGSTVYAAGAHGKRVANMIEGKAKALDDSVNVIASDAADTITAKANSVGADVKAASDEIDRRADAVEKAAKGN